MIGSALERNSSRIEEEEVIIFPFGQGPGRLDLGTEVSPNLKGLGPRVSTDCVWLKF